VAAVRFALPLWDNPVFESLFVLAQQVADKFVSEPMHFGH